MIVWSRKFRYDVERVKTPEWTTATKFPLRSIVPLHTTLSIERTWPLPRSEARLPSAWRLTRVSLRMLAA